MYNTEVFILDGILLAAPCVSSIQEYRPIFPEMKVSPV
jgi:hypothetical protein